MKKQFQSKAVPRGTRTIWRYLGALFILFTFAIGNVWADETYYLQKTDKASGSSPELTGDFYTTCPLSFSVDKTYGAVTYKKGLTFSGNMTSMGSNCKNPNYQVRYDCKTNNTEITVVVWNKHSSNSKKLYRYTIQENATIGSANTVSSYSNEGITKNSLEAKTYTVANDTRTSIYFAIEDKSNQSIVQIIAVEKGTKFPNPGEVGYQINFNAMRYIAPSGSVGTLDSTSTIGGVEMCMNDDGYYSKTAGKLGTNNTNYIKFKVATPVKLNFTTNNTKKYTVSQTKGSTANKITPEANKAEVIDLRTAGTYYINPQESSVQPIGLSFSAAPKVTYNANTGGGSMDPSYFTVVANGFTAPSGKMFKEWRTNADGTGTKYDEDDEIESDVTLFAIWEDAVTKYAVTKGTHANGDFTISPVEQKEGEKVTLAATPEDGYIFSSWSIVKTEGGSATGISVDANSQFVMPAYAVTVNATFVADPCHKYFWFSKAADATTAGVTNNENSFFTTSASGSNGVTSSITIDGTEYAITNRTGNIGSSDATIVSFTVPANKAGILYTNMSSSGSSGAGSSRTLYLKKSGVTVVTATDAIYGDGAQHNATIENIPTGTYTLHANNNVKVGMFALKACDATYHTITLNLDGGTGETSIQALDGVAATKPADPTKDHCAFAGWYKGESPYNWSEVVTEPFTLTAHWTQLYTVTFAAGEGSGDAPAAVPDKAQGETFEVPANTFTAPASKEFDKWNDGSADYAPGDTYTVGTANVVLTAQWKALVAKYTVIFKDGETTLDTKLFDVGTNPSDAGIDKTKPLYTFAAWQKDASDIALDDASWTSVAKDAEITLTARWEKVYAQSIDMEQFVIDNRKSGNWQAYLDGKGYVYASSNMSLDSLASNKTKNNYQYLGLKFEKNSEDTYVAGRLPANKLMIVKVGAIGNNTYMKINDTKVTTPAIVGGVEADSAAAYTYWYYTEEKTFSLFHEDGGTSILKGITITDPYEVSFDVNGGDDPIAAMYGTPAVTLPSATKGTESFLGWFDDATAGNKIGDAGQSYTPTANITLYAHWEAISTDNTLSDLKVGGVTVDGFSPAVHTYYVVLPYGTKPENIPAITATANSAKAKQVAIQQAVWAGDPYNCYRAQANVQAEDESWGYYDVRFSFAPKDGVSIIKVATTGGTNKTVTGLYAGDGDVNLSSSKKMDKGKYIGFTLDGTTLQAGDRINVHTTQASSSGGSHIIFYDNMTDKNELYDTEEIGGTGDNIFTINAAMVGATTAYVYRASDNAPTNWNGYVDYIEVTRAMNPVLTAITLAGVTADKGTGDAFSATLPNGTNLASMTVVPTIVKNGEGGSAAPTAAWAWGDNTYRVTDKDGDYTDYTITLTEAATPSAAPVITAQPASANYYEGAAIAALEVVATGESLTYQWYLGADAIDGATEATYTPTVSAIGTYVYHCVVTNTEAGHPATSLASDNATITIAEDPAAIKLIVDGTSGKELNTAAFYLGSSLTSVEIASVNHACVKLAGGATASTAPYGAGQNDDRVIAYNATTTKTKIQVTAYSNTNNARSYTLSFVEEGQTAAQAAEHNVILDLPTDYTIRETDWYTFDSDKNRTIYITIPGNNSNYHFLQVKVIESGEPIKKAGEIGYAMNFNVGRMIGKKQNLHSNFEGFDFYANNDYKVIQSTSMVISNADNDYIKFHAVAPMTLAVSTENAAYFYVTKGAKGTANETLSVANGVSYIDLDEAADWYISPKNGDVKITNIAFAAPKCAEPVIDADPESNTNFGQGNLTASVTAHATDGATLAYQWYNADGDAEVSGATDATLTTTTEGTYYVIITASKAGYENRSVQSANATLGYRDITIATLSALSYGTPATAIVLEADKYNYRVTLDEGTTDVPALAATATQAAYGATAVPTDATAFTDYKAVSTVLVTAEDGTTTQTYTVTFVVQHIYAVMEDVTESTTWNWTGSVDQTIDDVVNKGLILANYIDGDNFEKIEGKAGEYARRNQNGGVYQGTHLHFNTTVAGKVKFYFRAPSSGETCTITVKNGGRTTIAGARGNSLGWSSEVFVNGDVVIEMENDKEGGGTTRVQQVVFTAAEADYTRDVTEGKYGTICLPNGGVMVGAALYEVAYFDASQKKIFFDEVLNGEMVAGRPYIFLPEENVTQLKVYYTDAANAAAGNYHGLFGSYTKEPLAQNAGNYILYNNQYLLVNSDYVYVGENRAYIKIGGEGGVPTNAVAPAPGRRRVAMGVLNEQVITGVEDLNVGDQPVKVMIDGQLFILRGEKMYDARGRLVK